MITRRVLVAVAMVTLVGCTTGGVMSSSPSSSTPSEAPSVSGSASQASLEPSPAAAEITIFGAASLAKVLDEVETSYEAATTGTTLTISTDSSAALETKIEQGAPADVFLSADTTNPQKLVDGGFADGAPVVFAGNKLTIIIPIDNPGGLTGPFDLAKRGVRVVAAGDEVPITKYAKQLVHNLAREASAPPAFAASYAANVVSKEDNVAGVRAKIELGEGDAAIVYLTDAAASDTVATITVPDGVNVPATYAGVVVRASANVAAAHAFLDWFAGPDGRAILAGFGFLPPVE